MKGITIDKTLTIDGNKHTIDGENAASIFNVTSEGVKLQNITFEKGKSTATKVGGAITAANTAGITIEGCNFNNCAVSGTKATFMGGAIYSAAKALDVTKCNFKSCSVTGDRTVQGGAIYADTAGAAITSSYFVGCMVTTSAAGISYKAMWATQSLSWARMIIP